MSFSTLCRAFFYCLSTAISALFRHIYQRSLKKKSGLTSMTPLFIPRYFKINKVKKIVFPSSTIVDFIFSPANFVVFFIITKRKNMLYNIFFNTFALFLHISPLKHTIKHFILRSNLLQTRSRQTSLSCSYSAPLRRPHKIEIPDQPFQLFVVKLARVSQFSHTQRLLPLQHHPNNLQLTFVQIRMIKVSLQDVLSRESFRLAIFHKDKLCNLMIRLRRKSVNLLKLLFAVKPAHQFPELHNPCRKFRPYSAQTLQVCCVCPVQIQFLNSLWFSWHSLLALRQIRLRPLPDVCNLHKRLQMTVLFFCKSVNLKKIVRCPKNAVLRPESHNPLRYVTWQPKPDKRRRVRLVRVKRKCVSHTLLSPQRSLELSNLRRIIRRRRSSSRHLREHKKAENQNRHDQHRQ